jgi:hypothetical protein
MLPSFFCCRDFEMFRAFLELDGRNMYGIRGIVLVDPPNEYDDPVTDLSLVSQRYHGFFEDEHLRDLMRSRLLHCYEYGAYDIGRHNSRYDQVMHPPGALILWFGFSPWNDKFIQRKLQIQKRLTDSDKLKGYGCQHILNKDELNDLRLHYTGFSINLRTRIEYKQLFSAWPFEN